MQFFGDKYGEWVRVVQVGGAPTGLDGYSMELCAGTHVRHTGEIGLLRITGENAIAAGVRRIEAVAGLAAYGKAREEAELLKALAGVTQAPVHDVLKRVEQLLEQTRDLERKLKAFRDREADALAQSLAAGAKEQGGLRLVTALVTSDDAASLRELGAKVAGKVGPAAVVVLGAAIDGKASVVANCGADAVKAGQAAGKIVAEICGQLGGKGGGKPEAAMGGAPATDRLESVLAARRG
jgi:alanyl-tRNA synthetase